MRFASFEFSSNISFSDAVQCNIILVVFCEWHYRITSAVATFSDHVMLNETHTNVTLVRHNIIFQVVRFKDVLQGYGLAIDNLTWNDNSTNHLVTFRNFSAEIITQSESAIYFSEETLNNMQHRVGS